MRKIQWSHPSCTGCFYKRTINRDHCETWWNKMNEAPRNILSLYVLLLQQLLSKGQLIYTRSDVCWQALTGVSYFCSFPVTHLLIPFSLLSSRLFSKYSFGNATLCPTHQQMIAVYGVWLLNRHLHPLLSHSPPCYKAVPWPQYY